MSSPSQSPKLIHVAYLPNGRTGNRFLFLRRIDPQNFAWFEETTDGTEKQTEVTSYSAEEALRLAYRQWKSHSIRMLGCGFRYTLPERDEHGVNALFHQMASSYATPTGIYFDEELGNNCIVHFASQQARDLLQKLRSQNRL